MRIDKFLKLSRLVKRRTTAQEMVSVGAILLNSRRAKPSSVVHVGDRIEIAFPKRIITAEICVIDENALKQGASAVSVTEERRMNERGEQDGKESFS